MKFLLSLSLIPLLLLTNVSAAEELPLPTQEQENSPFHKYENPTTPDGYPLVAFFEDDDTILINSLKIAQKRANGLCILLGHKEAGVVLKKDLDRFEGEAYLEGEIIKIEAETNWIFWTTYKSSIFKTLRCIK